MIKKVKGKILIEIPEHYMMESWSFNYPKHIPARTVDITSWLSIKKAKRNQKAKGGENESNRRSKGKSDRECA